MRNTKLYSVLEYFDKKEQSHLKKFLESAYFNSNEDLVKIFDLTIKHLNAHHNEKPFEKKEVWKAVQGKKPYDDVRFRKYMSDLLKLIESFLAQRVYEQTPLLQATTLLEAVEQKDLEKIYNSAMRTARRLSEQATYREANYYFHQYQIELNYYKLTDFENKRTVATNEKEMVQNLDYFYLAEKLRIYCSILSRQSIVNSKTDLLFFEEIISHIEKHKFDQIPAITIYYQIYLTQTDIENEEHFFKLKELLNEHYELFPPSQSYDMYTFAINYCIRKSNAGAANFLKELFFLYKELLQKDHIISNIEFSPWHFRNIVAVGTRHGEYDWVENFINEFQHFLPSNFRLNAVTYNLATLYFYQKKYDLVIEKLRDIEFEDFSYNLNSKSMLIATYYETEETEPLYSLFDSFRTYLRRHRDLPGSRRVLYTNLIKFTKKLTKLTYRDKKGIQKLKEELEATKNIASRNWLLEKIAEMES